jgi:protoheme IX farnesyltransferase
MIGWAVATGGISIESVLMFALIFMWTPPHFWALALFTKSDYSNAGVPMLTVTHGRPAARLQIFVYTVLLAALAIGMGFTAAGGPIYLAVAVVLNAQFLWGAFKIWRRDDVASDADSHLTERKFFKLSLLYLFLHFGALLLEATLRPIGWGGWG